jgi:hypothetical protein
MNPLPDPPAPARTGVQPEGEVAVHLALWAGFITIFHRVTSGQGMVVSNTRRLPARGCHFDGFSLSGVKSGVDQNNHGAENTINLIQANDLYPMV